MLVGVVFGGLGRIEVADEKLPADVVGHAP
ncbi:hypothetical protein SDC9_203784 [bioreactor metagenome]|uniref:Uncharacterized protein n=1 Tax=bioreactor metagenome TaxID=1076179 RepID=A0A645IXG0_9ZZZZ